MNLIFEVETPLKFWVRCTKRHWDFIVSEKHPVMVNQEDNIRLALKNPDEIRKSRKDERVFLFYKKGEKRYFCAVIRRVKEEAFLITAYPADAVKAGDIIWTKSK